MKILDSPSNTFKEGLIKIIKCYPNLSLAGSWSVGEEHAGIKLGTQTYSFSDIDVRILSNLSSVDFGEIEKKLLRLSNRTGFVLQGISMRPQHEMADIWNVAAYSNRKPHESFLIFWLAIGYIEVAHFLESFQRPSPLKDPAKKYAISKFFLKQIINIQLVENRADSCCYSSALNTSCLPINRSLARGLLDLKLGRIHNIPKESITATSKAVFEYLNKIIMAKESRQFLSFVEENVESICSELNKQSLQLVLSRVQDMSHLHFLKNVANDAKCKAVNINDSRP